MTQRLVKLAKKFNVGTSTLVAFARACGYELDNKPTAAVPVDLAQIIQMRYGKSTSSHLTQCPLCSKDIQNKHIANHLKQHAEASSRKKRPPRAANTTIISQTTRLPPKVKKQKKRKKKKVPKQDHVRIVLSNDKYLLRPKLTLADITRTETVSVQTSSFYFESKRLTIFYNNRLYERVDNDIRSDFQGIADQHAKEIVVRLNHKSSTVDWSHSLTAYLLAIRDQWRKSAVQCSICNVYFPESEYDDHRDSCIEIPIKMEQPPPAIQTKKSQPPVPLSRLSRSSLIKDERLLDICNSIAEQRNHEKYCKAESRGRFVFINHVTGKPHLWWLYNDIPSTITHVKSLTGSVGNVVLNSDMYKVYRGSAVSKNSKLVGELLMSEKGVVTMANGAVMHLQSRATYYPTRAGTTANVSIQHKKKGKTNEKTIQSASLTGLIERVERLIKKHDSNITDSSICSRLNKQVKQLKSLDMFTDAKPFVREALHLRYQDILSQQQESVKRSNIFDGCTIVIDGGPGTGKTTTLIQRIRFLTSPIAIREYLPNISEEYYQKITNTASRNWVFYSPTKLLADYLKLNLINEGLEATNEYVLVWEDELSRYVRLYGLSAKKVLLNKYYDDPSLLKTLVANIRATHLKRLRGRILEDNITLARLRTPSLVAIYGKLKKAQNDSSPTSRDNLSIASLRQVYGRLQAVYLDSHEDSVTLEQLHTAMLKSRTALVQKALHQLTTDQKDRHLSLLPSSRKENPDFSHETILKTDIQRGIVLLCESHLQKKRTVGSDRLQMFLPVIKSICSSSDLEHIGDVLALYRQFSFLKATFASFLLDNLLGTFEVFLRQYQNSEDEMWVRDDVCLFVGLINEYSRTLYRSKMMPSIGLPELVQIYAERKKNIIAVDEASDLSLSELFCINSFRDYDDKITSVTLCGDIMQRMTTAGIQDWDLMDGVLADFEVRELRTSYRQSPTLLELAKSLYTNIKGEGPTYTSHLTKYDAEPRPLLFVHTSSNDRLRWIIDRIADVNNSYGGKLPATAIFVPTVSDIPVVVAALANINTSSKVSYQGYRRDRDLVLKRNEVAVFAVDQIKGLEFEVVFFLDLDELVDSIPDTDILQRYLYVGLSRAAFYFGVTVSKPFDGKLTFLNKVLSTDLSWT